MKFKIDSKNPSRGHPAIVKCESILRSLKTGDLLTLKNLASKSGYSFGYLSRFATDISRDLVSGDISRNRSLFGNPQTIKAWNAQKLQN